MYSPQQPTSRHHRQVGNGSVGVAGEDFDQANERDQQGETTEDHEKSTDLASLTEDEEHANVLTVGHRRLDNCAVVGGVVGADASNIGEQDQTEAEATQHEQREYREEDQHGMRVPESLTIVHPHFSSVPRPGGGVR